MKQGNSESDQTSDFVCFRIVVQSPPFITRWSGSMTSKRVISEARYRFCRQGNFFFFFFFFTNNFFFCYKYRIFLKRHWRNQPLTSAPVSPDDYMVYDGTIFCFVYSVHVIYELRTCLRASSCNFVVDG